MNKKYLLYLLFFTISCILYAQNVISPRVVQNFNREWKYARGDYREAEQTIFNDNNWEVVGLPHSFSIPYFMSKDFYVGYGWYRKLFTIPTEQLAKKHFLEFDGIFQEAEVFMNGKLVGTHIGGYTGFSMDITSAIKQGTNLVAIRTNNIWKPNVAPRAGEHVFSGGIYRNVRLVVKSPVYIDWYGTFITTPDLKANNGKSSTVKITTDVCNGTRHTADYKLLTQIIDLKGKVIASVESVEKIAANSFIQFRQTTKPVRKPHLWHPKHPSLYKVVSSLFQGKTLLDREETSFGFRWTEWTADRGFFLNGKHLFFQGANVHQDQAGWGDAVTESAMRRDVHMMKEAGFDLIRGSHYPHAPAFSKACDEEGMLFWSEAPFWGIGGYKPDGYWNSSAYPVNQQDEAGFESSALKQLEEMIRIHRNHPSIVAWSMCNEPFFTAPQTMKGVRRLLKKMVDLSHQLDPTRPAAVGGAQRPLGKDRIDLIGDIAGYNGDGSSVPDFQQPPVPSVVSEYGSTTADRPGKYIPGWGDLEKNDCWKGLPWRSGQAIWCGFDHGSIAGKQLGKMGIVDYFRLPKRSWYWYRNEYAKVVPPEWPANGIPAQLGLEATKVKGIRADGTDDVMLIVSILDAGGKQISNSPSVTLKLVAGPGEFPTGTSISFDKDSDICIADGKAAIAFRSYYAGKSIIEATSSGLKPARIEILFEGAPAYEESKTPKVKERPYMHFKQEKAIQTAQTFGRNNPTFAGSQLAGNPAGMAADGNQATWWQAAEEDLLPIWTLDTEKGLTLRHIRILFPKVGIYHYKIETSDDKEHWNLILDNQDSTIEEVEREIKFTDKEKEVCGRFLRISFRQTALVSPAAIAEVEVTGIVRE